MKFRTAAELLDGPCAGALVEVELPPPVVLMVAVAEAYPAEGRLDGPTPPPRVTTYERVRGPGPAALVAYRWAAGGITSL